VTGSPPGLPVNAAGADDCRAKSLEVLRLYQESMPESRSRPFSKGATVSHDFARKAEGFLAEGRLDAARSILQAGIEKFPEYPSGYQLLGDLYSRSGNDISATFAYLEALSRDPDNALTLLRLGDIFRAQGQLREAQKYYQSAARLDPESPALRERLGETETQSPAADDLAFMTETAADLYLHQGHTDKAKAIYLHLIKQNPGNRQLQEKLQRCGG
jgi:tetratricopeptide (TPR) repeat protein